MSEIDPLHHPPLQVGRRFVRFWIFLAASLFLGAVFFIGWRWVTIEEPSSVLIVDGSEALKGAKVTVQGSENITPLSDIFAQDRYSLPFYLDAGDYTVRVTLDGRTVDQREVTLPPRVMLHIDLSQRPLGPPATAPAQTLPAPRGDGDFTGHVP